MLGELAPDAGEVVVGGAAGLADDGAVPARVVVDVEDAEGAGVEAGLHQEVVFAEVGGVESAAEVVVDEVLPGDGEAESVHVVVFDEVGHLARAGVVSCGGRDDGERGWAYPSLPKNWVSGGYTAETVQVPSV